MFRLQFEELKNKYNKFMPTAQKKKLPRNTCSMIKDVKKHLRPLTLIRRLHSSKINNFCV